MVYVIVVTYNGSKWIERCFNSVYENKVSLKLLAIDNGSSDNTVSVIKQRFPDVEVFETGKNLGFGQANNIGLKLAIEKNADYVFLLNQDAFIASDCLDILIQTSEVNKNYAILSPFHLNYSGDAIEEYFKKYIVAIGSPDYISDLYFARVNKIYDVSFIHAAGWLLPIEMVKEVGGFDPLFFHYGEDNDYVQRVLFRNYKIGFVPQSIMYHQGTNAGLSHEKAFSIKTNFATLHLKNPKASFAGAMLVFTKGIFDGITSGVLYRNRKRIKEEWRLTRNVIKSIRKIRRSRQKQLDNFAYLNN